jgi:hypothetical protein
MAFLNELDDLLRRQFDLNQPFSEIDDRVVVNTFAFSSEMRSPVVFSDRIQKEEGASELSGQSQENRNFRYAVFRPAGQLHSKKAIVLLHGLNERSWDKYLTWAYNLTKFTGRPVVLFPLANHVNRSPSWWSFPRRMTEVVRKRQNYYGKIPNSSFVNVALSYRLDHCPEVFVSSGLQSISDLVKLAEIIRSGSHPLFEPGAKMDFFAYSIGALVTEVLLMANPGEMFSTSKAFFFCGGATFDQMDGRSRNILDNRAFRSLKEFVVRSDFMSLITGLPNGMIPYGNALIKSFSSLVSFNNWQKDYQSVRELLSGRIHAIGLKLDKVIPGEAISRTLCIGGFCENVVVADFDFKHSHEQPFPLQNKETSGRVEEAFFYIFRKASGFLNQG